MAQFEIVEVAPRSIIYVVRTTASDPGAIGAGMQEAFEALFALMSEQRIRPLGAPVAIYDSFSPEETTYRVGFPVTEEDCRRVSESALCGETPDGRALRGVHRGPYGELPKTYQAMMDHMEASGLQMDGPAWEIYLSDPAETSQEALETEVYLPVKPLEAQ